MVVTKQHLAIVEVLVEVPVIILVEVYTLEEQV